MTIDDDILPRAAPTDEQQSRWNALVPEERTKRFAAILLAGFQDAEASTQGEKVALSRQANNDLSAIAQAYGEAYAQDVTAYVRMIADGKGISRRYSRDGFEFRRFRTQKHDIYFRYHGDGIAVARVLVPYFMRPDKGQPAKAPRPPRV
ncbi:MAG: type II toxin-antitoxin system RelE/ParE family toxin [Nitratireductor sp.]|nr:type II toxin-antitoxin system RelE/ParE family toxin [Nitratireductor sp.]